MEYIDIELPFSGFYESVPDQQIDDALEQRFSDDHGDITEAQSEALFMADINWKAIEAEYCKELVDQWSDALDTELVYKTFTSPKYYNFETDRLFCKAPADRMNQIRAEVEAYPEWSKYIKDNFTSYDGFWSYYSNDSTDTDWTRPELDECQWRVIIKAYSNHHEIDPVGLECEVNVYELDTINEATKAVEKYIKAQVKR